MAHEVIRIQFGGVDYTRFIVDMNPQVKEGKKQVVNLKGKPITLRSRASVLAATLEVTLPYISIQKKLELEALFKGGNTVEIQHNLDAPSGLVECIDWKTTIIKTMDGILYNIVITLASTSSSPSGMIQPINPHHLAAVHVNRMLGCEVVEDVVS